MPSNRVYKHYSDLEEFHAGMWRIVRGEERSRNAELSASLMRDPHAFQAAMERALVEWPQSCEYNLTAENANRLAWLGHAGCCLAVGVPEENTRLGWHKLTPSEQAAANVAAQRVLFKWQQLHEASEPQRALFNA